MQQIRDLAQYNEQSTIQISNQSKIYLGLLPESHVTELAEHHAYRQHHSYHAHQEVLQTWHHQMHERSHQRHHQVETPNPEPIRTSLTTSYNSQTMRYLLGLEERPNTFNYSPLSSKYHQQESNESNFYSHSGKRQRSRQHYAASNHHSTSDLSKTAQSWNSYQRQTENSFSKSQESLQRTIAILAVKNADKIGTVGDCAKGPRLTFQALGLDLPQVTATEQGRILENSGLFTRVSRDDVQPGDYGYRHWANSVVRKHGGVDKGDSFIVANVGRHGELMGANDHHFVVPADGGRYRDTTFLRPTAAFYARYANLIQHRAASNA